MSTKPTLWITRRLPEAVERALGAAFVVRSNPDDRHMSAEELQRAFCEADAVLCTVTDRVNADCLEHPERRARIVANFGVGVNHIDVQAATRARVVVTNTPEVLTDDTADLTMLLMLAVMRRASEGERELRAGKWTGWRPTHLLGARLTMLLMLAVMRRAGEGERELRAGQWTGWRPTHLLGARLTGKTLGIVGFGRIGAAVARRARYGFGMNVLVWTRSPETATAPGVTVVKTLDALLAQSDIVSLHCPSTPSTRKLIGAPQLAMMKPTAYLVNTARGDVVDEAALVAALDARQIAGAGLDVFEAEPSVHAGLLRRDDVVLLPHIGSATHETREAMGLRAMGNLLAFFDGQAPDDRVA